MTINPHIFESLMLICFGSAWPFSILKTWRQKSSKGKSILFLYIILAGYFFGILFKTAAGIDKVIYLYILNFLMVFIDLSLALKYRKT